jgi:hypothetical protein
MSPTFESMYKSRLETLILVSQHSDEDIISCRRYLIHLIDESDDTKICSCSYLSSFIRVGKYASYLETKNGLAFVPIPTLLLCHFLPGWIVKL